MGIEAIDDRLDSWRISHAGDGNFVIDHVQHHESGISCKIDLNCGRIEHRAGEDSLKDGRVVDHEAAAIDCLEVREGKSYA